ncbi:hypothetical protein [Streptomyces yerevanensis]|uniref:hypothetical protein n=1 Tax=Streptomyces yerevanensis TaxID=66378 RepID=UPI0012FEDCC4|nr:hypothetical protein [Streptomyces yerevanensis]
MKQAYLWFVFNLWLLITPYTLIGYYIPWAGGTRIPGRRLSRLPLLGSVGRPRAKARLSAVKEVLGDRPEYRVLENEHCEHLLSQVHAHATWARLSRVFLMAPGALAVVALAFVLAPAAGHTPSPPLIGLYTAFFLFSVCLTGIDSRAIRNADSAGTVSVAAVAVLESFTTRADAVPAKSTPALWQSGLIEELCTALVRRAHRESLGAVPASRQSMANDTALLVRNLRHRAALVHSANEDETRRAREHELWSLVCGVLTYSSRPRAQVRDFHVVDAGLLSDVSDAGAAEATVPSLKARVLVPLVFMGAVIGVAVVLGVTGAAGEFAPLIVFAMAAAAAPLAHRFGVTVLDALVEPPALPVAPPAAPRQDEPERTPEQVRSAA